jgi:hypothetical protein
MGGHAWVAIVPWPQLAVVGLAWAIATGFYYTATLRVPAWGRFITGAFDSYLPALAERIGFVLPDTAEARFRFWDSYSRMLIYRRNPDGTFPFEPKNWAQRRPAVGADASETGAKEKSREPDEEDDGEAAPPLGPLAPRGAIGSQAAKT